VLVKEIKPKIKGVAVVCRGISGEDMQLKIINLVSTVLNLPANKVYVISAD
jgi:stage III sporulation protein AG